MIARTSVLLALLIGVLVQYVIPDRPVYQYGWYNVLLAALFVTALLQSRSSGKPRAPKSGWTSGMIVLRAGMGLIALAGIANGLLAPAPQTIVGAPGTRTPIADPSGTLIFQPVESDRDVLFANASKEEALCGGMPRFVRSFELWCVPRSVVAVQALNGNGAHLTITQPAGTAFLSPVLLFTQTQAIAGIPLPYDSFALPAAHRIVNTVYFDARHAAALRGVTSGQPAVLFAVDDDNNQPLPHAIRLAASGQRVAVGGIELTATFLQYPAIRIVPVPLPLLVVLGLIGIAAGMWLHIRERRTAKAHPSSASNENSTEMLDDSEESR